MTSAGLQACYITELPCGRDGFPAIGVLKHQGGLPWKGGQAEKLRKGRPWDESRAPGRSQQWGGGGGGRLERQVRVMWRDVTLSAVFFQAYLCGSDLTSSGHLEYNLQKRKAWRAFEAWGPHPGFLKSDAY